MRKYGPFDPKTGRPGAADSEWSNGNPSIGQPGSIPPIEAIEAPMDEITAVIDAILGDGTPGSGQDEDDRAQLLKAIQKAISSGDADKLDGQHGAYYTDITARLGYAPANTETSPNLPHVETSDRRLRISVSGGSVSLDSEQSWIWRGGRRIVSDNLPQQAFPTQPSRTYHLRWHAPGTGIAADVAEYPDGRLELADMSGETEASEEHDTTFDRMLIARIVTDGSGALAVTPLRNAVQTHEMVELSTSVVDGGTNDMLFERDFSYDLAVTPRVHAHLREFQTDAVDGTGDIRDHDTYTRVSDVTRYGARVHGRRDFAISVEITAIYWVQQ